MINFDCEKPHNMAIPNFSEIREPALRLLTNGDAIKVKDFTNPLAKHFSLTDEDVNKMYPTGNGQIFQNRVSWTLSYLFMAGLVERPKRGVYKISPKGMEILKTPDKIVDFVDKAVAASEPKETSQKKKGAQPETSVADSQTPQEKLFQSYTNIRENIYSEILTTILSKTPAEFEKLVVSLLQKMGYGGEIKDSGSVTKMSNDEGIDGIIKEDILGFGRIHIQAKRYKLDVRVGREDIQKFVGALAGTQSSKGVFITTSRFAKTAEDYVKNLSTTIVLIDGQKLAGYIYDYGLGMQVEDVLEVKRLDTDYWDRMKDDEQS
jgi:restriction system protein